MKSSEVDSTGCSWACRSCNTFQTPIPPPITSARINSFLFTLGVSRTLRGNSSYQGQTKAQTLILRALALGLERVQPSSCVAICVGLRQKITVPDLHVA